MRLISEGWDGGRLRDANPAGLSGIDISIVRVNNCKYNTRVFSLVNSEHGNGIGLVGCYVHPALRRYTTIQSAAQVL